VYESFGLQTKRHSTLQRQSILSVLIQLKQKKASSMQNETCTQNVDISAACHCTIWFVWNGRKLVLCLLNQAPSRQRKQWISLWTCSQTMFVAC